MKRLLLLLTFAAGSCFAQTAPNLSLACTAVQGGQPIGCTITLAGTTAVAATQWTLSGGVGSTTAIAAVLASTDALVCNSNPLCILYDTQQVSLPNGVVANITIPTTAAQAGTNLQLQLTGTAGVNLAGTAVVMGPSPAVTVAISGPPPALTSLACTPGSVQGGSPSPSTCTATLTSAALSGGAVVTLSSNNAAVTVPGSITIPSGSSSGTFTATTTAVASQQAAVITAAFSGATKTAPLTITVPVVTVSLSQLSCPASVVGGNPLNCSVTLSGPAPSGGAVVVLGKDGPITVPASITVAAGSTSANFTVTTTAVTSTITFPFVTATYAGVTQTAPLTITPALSKCDLNQDGVVDQADVTQEVAKLLAVPPVAGDLNQDGVTDLLDVQIVANASAGLACTAR